VNISSKKYCTFWQSNLSTLWPWKKGATHYLYESCHRGSCTTIVSSINSSSVRQINEIAIYHKREQKFEQ